jgi:hypothetical protein
VPRPIQGANISLGPDGVQVRDEDIRDGEEQGTMTCVITGAVSR